MLPSYEAGVKSVYTRCAARGTIKSKLNCTWTSIVVPDLAQPGCIQRTADATCLAFARNAERPCGGADCIEHRIERHGVVRAAACIGVCVAHRAVIDGIID